MAGRLAALTLPNGLLFVLFVLFGGEEVVFPGHEGVCVCVCVCVCVGVCARVCESTCDSVARRRTGVGGVRMSLILFM